MGGGTTPGAENGICCRDLCYVVWHGIRPYQNQRVARMLIAIVLNLFQVKNRSSTQRTPAYPDAIAQVSLVLLETRGKDRVTPSRAKCHVP